MSAFAPIPLGHPIPAGPHSVSCSLPTLRDVRGYEEKDPAVLAALQTGYPRFVVHPLVCTLARHLAPRVGAEASTLWLTSSRAMAGALAHDLLEHGGRAVEIDGLGGVVHPTDPKTYLRAKRFLQNRGGFLSSREAEDHLLRLGQIQSLHPETSFAGNAAAEVRRHLLPRLTGAEDRDLVVTNCGMNAIWSALSTSADLQAARGRTIWIQMGWLYLDTIALLQITAGKDGDYVYHRDVCDLDSLRHIFALHGSRIAGVIAEVPTNPLIQTPDLAELSRLCRTHGAHLLIDPSIASIYAVDVLPYADVLVTSLTKYTASEGDLTAGLCAINPGTPDADALRQGVARRAEPLYQRDLARLAAEIPETPAVLEAVNAGTARVVETLRRHPAVGRVHWALQEPGRDSYLAIARTPQATGGMVTFTLARRGTMERFYDHVRLPKGPSFGMKSTLLCPFMYLAHYDLVSTPAGLAELAASRLDPDLIRLCVGIEPPEAILEALVEALDPCLRP